MRALRVTNLCLSAPRPSALRGAPAATRTARAATAATALVLGALVGCVSERERLDVPTVTLEVTSPPPPPGGRVAGRAEASDASGLISLAVYACTADSVFRDNAPLDRERSVTLDFSLHVSSAAAAGAPVEVYAATFDDQGFVAEASQVVYVGGVPGTSGEGLCRRVRPASAAALAGPTAAAP